MAVDSPTLENSILTLSQLALKKKEKNCCRIFLNSRDDYLLLYFFFTWYNSNVANCCKNTAITFPNGAFLFVAPSFNCEKCNSFYFIIITIFVYY